MKSGTISLRSALALLCLAGFAVLAVPGSASAAVSCSLAGGTLQVDVTGTGAQQIGLRMDTTPDPDEIEVHNAINLNSEQVCAGGPATVANTEAINVTDTDPGVQQTLAKVSLIGGPFLNSTAEGGGDPEIEITVNGGDENNDDLILDPGPGSTNDNFRFGELTATPATKDEGINLNGLETAAVDGDDVRMLEMEVFQAITANGGDDVMDARGGPEFAGPMTIPSTKQLDSGTGDDEVYAGNGNGWLIEGGTGADMMIGGPNNDQLRATSGAENDIVDGNAGTDSCSWQNHNAGVRVDLTDPNPQDTIGAGVDTVTDCENLVGGSMGDTLIGGPTPNQLLGTAGADTLRPGPGNVADTVDGGADFDTADYSDVPVGVTLNLANVPQATGGAGTDTFTDALSDGDSLPDIEGLIGTPAADSLTGNSAQNHVTGGEGVDTVTLLEDDDSFDSYDASADVIDCGPGTDSGQASEPGVDSLTDCENVDYAPSTDISNGPSEGAASQDATPTYELTSVENGVDFQVSVDGGPFTDCAASCMVPALTDGAHSLRFRAVEGAAPGRPDPTPAMRTYLVDRQAPAISIDSGPQGETTETAASFAFSSDDPQATFECRVDGGAFGPCSGPASHAVSGLTPGSHLFEVRGSDAIGNAAVATRAWTVVQQGGQNPDTTAPDTVIRKPKVKGSSVRLRFGSTEPGSTFTCRLDRKRPRPCASPTGYRNLDEGKHKVRVAATDAAGNADLSPAGVKFRIR